MKPADRSDGDQVEREVSINDEEVVDLVWIVSFALTAGGRKEDLPSRSDARARRLHLYPTKAAVRTADE